jgi:hypothetical protein
LDYFSLEKGSSAASSSIESAPLYCLENGLLAAIFGFIAIIIHFYRFVLFLPFQGICSSLGYICASSVDSEKANACADGPINDKINALCSRLLRVGFFFPTSYREIHKHKAILL